MLVVAKRFDSSKTTDIKPRESQSEKIISRFGEPNNNQPQAPPPHSMNSLRTRTFSMALLAVLTFSFTTVFGQQLYYPHPASVQGFPISGISVSATHQLLQGGFLDSLSHEEFDDYYKGRSADESSSATKPSGAADQVTSEANSEADSRGRFDITPNYGAFTSPNLKGNTYTLPLYSTFKLTDRVGLSLNVPVQYTQFRSPLGELNVWNATATVGLPIKVIKKTKDLPFAWTITPHGGAGGYFADDTGNSHTFVGHGGLTSMVGYENRHFSISMANQITCYETISRSGSYDFTDAVHQEILKNGLKVSVPFGRRWVADAYGIHTRFLENAFMQEYVTVGASVGYHRPSMKKGSYLKIGTYTELGKTYQSIHFQFGTGWKF